jgi:hypothetical protein
MKTFQELGTEIGALVEEKNAAYGSSFAKAGDFLRLLYPAGLRPEQYTDMLLLVRIFDKQMRIATNRDALGESPFLDVAGYGILGAHLHWQRREAQATWQGTASTAADGASQGPSDSATASAPTPTTPSGDANSAKTSPPPSSSPCSSTSESTDAPAPSATASASDDVDGRAENSAKNFSLQRLRFFRDLVARERLTVLNTLRVLPEEWSAGLTSSAEQIALRSLRQRTSELKASIDDILYGGLKR